MGVPDSGFKSSEFVLSTGATVAMLSGFLPEKYMPYVAGLVGVYAFARTALKIAHAVGWAKQVPDLPGLPGGTGEDQSQLEQVVK